MKSYLTGCGVEIVGEGETGLDVVRGASNREIAEVLLVADNTVKYHLKNILQKLRLLNRAQVVAYALRRGVSRSASWR